ncbi:mitochondrial small ribosomal subunit Rsm22-domain-containing protein [Zopfochytrium polystomum]|nr:mitochondrial small ribosomal subunit Rsm22-domain-containing protein [Zopfochytrium polystomum]
MLQQVLTALKVSSPLSNLHPRSVLSVGSLLGASVWAAVDVWRTSLETVVAVESSLETGRVIDTVAKYLQVDNSPKFLLRRLLTYADKGEVHDSVVADNCDGNLWRADAECLSEDARMTIDSLWAQTTGTLVYIDEGTTEGYRRMLLVRQHLLATYGDHGHVVGPNGPHSCVSLVRVQCEPGFPKPFQFRHGGFADVRFSYLSFKRGLSAEPNLDSRVVRPPLKRDGHIILDVCRPQGDLFRTIITKAKGAGTDQYARARKSRWGDSWGFPVEMGREID